MDKKKKKEQRFSASEVDNSFAKSLPKEAEKIAISENCDPRGREKDEKENLGRGFKFQLRIGNFFSLFFKRKNGTGFDGRREETRRKGFINPTVSSSRDPRRNRRVFGFLDF